MTDREKLARLLMDSPTLDVMFGETIDEWYNAADYLISKGVTIPVRCVECKWRLEEKMLCLNKRNQVFNTGIYAPNENYCSYGERREE